MLFGEAEQHNSVVNFLALINSAFLYFLEI